MNFLNYSETMDADFKILEDKLNKLILLCGSLREENTQLRENLSQERQNADVLKSNMQKASAKLQGLLEVIPQNEEAL